MDQDKKEKGLHTIQSLKANGMGDSSIKSTLATMGFSSEEIGELLSATQSAVQQKTSQQVIPSRDTKPEETPIEKQSPANDTNVAYPVKETHEDLSLMHSDLQKHIKTLDELHSNLDDMGQEENIESEVHEIKKIVEELKPMMVSIKELNEKLLDLNKRVLMRL